MQGLTGNYWKGELRKAKLLNADMFDFFFRKISNPDNEFFHTDQDILDYVNDRVNDDLQEMFDMLNTPIGVHDIREAITQNLGRAAEKICNFMSYSVMARRYWYHT